MTMNFNALFPPHLVIGLKVSSMTAAVSGDPNLNPNSAMIRIEKVSRMTPYKAFPAPPLLALG